MDRVIKNLFNLNRIREEEVDDIVAEKKASYKEEQKKLDHLVQRSHSILLRISSVFPFQIFTTQIIVDQNKIDIIYNRFFKSAEVFSILIRNINFVTIETSLIFASLTVEVRGFEQNPIPIEYLWKKDAIRARRIIMGLITCSGERIDLSVFPPDELRRKVEEIGIARGG